MITAMLAMSMLADGVSTKFIAEGAVKRSGGYSPIRAEFNSTKPASVKKAPDGLTNPMYGQIKFGDKSVGFIIDDVETSKIFVDSNNDGNYTNDAAATWAPSTNNGMTMYSGGTKIDIGRGAPVQVNFYRFDPKDPNRAPLKSTLLFYADFGYEITLSLAGKDYPGFVTGEPGANTRIGVDRNGDGKTSFNYETVTVGKPFNYTGTTYVLNLKDGKLSLDKAAEQLPIAKEAPNLSVGAKALEFSAKTLDGTDIKFPSSFKGKVVMIDFWATWCGPCIAELPNLTKAYEQYHEKGFEVLGISFDQENMADKVNAFTREKNMPWKQVYEGKYWSTTIGAQYDVSAIPFCLLVDGDTGEILATVGSLRGEKIFETIEKALKAKNGR